MSYISQWPGGSDYTSNMEAAKAFVKVSSVNSIGYYPYYQDHYLDPDYGFWPTFATNLLGEDNISGLLTGNWSPPNCGMAAHYVNDDPDTSKINQRINIDLGSSKVIKRIHVENAHWGGYQTEWGVKHFTVWGTDNEYDFSATSDGNTRLSWDDGDWTQINGYSDEGLVNLISGSINAGIPKHVGFTNAYDPNVSSGGDVVDPFYIYLSNSSAFRYYSIKFLDNWSPPGEYMWEPMVYRFISLQTFSPVGGFKVNGVAYENIGSVNGVSLAALSKVNGVNKTI